MDGMRSHVMDGFAPVLDAISQPAAGAASAVEWMSEYGRLHDENLRLKDENAKLLEWQQAALRLEAENSGLRGLLKYRPDPALQFVTARVIADPGGAYVRTLLVSAGRRDGVHKGEAAMSAEGLIGRVVDVGEWSSRVLLLTDLNSGIPVMLENSRNRAILEGNNSAEPRLLYLPHGTTATVGERVVTSGTGGMIPPGLPVGVVSATADHGGVAVRPMVDMDRVEYVRLVDFNLPGLAVGTDPAGLPLGQLP